MSRTPITDAVDVAIGDLVGALVEIVIAHNKDNSDEASEHAFDIIETALLNGAEILYTLCNEGVDKATQQKGR